MALADITSLLKNIALDRKTKLQVITILAANADVKIEENIEMLLRSFDEMNKDEENRLITRLTEIERTFQERVKVFAGGIEKTLRSVQDDMYRNDEIEKIRQSLKGL